jgi:hypothetical protein
MNALIKNLSVLLFLNTTVLVISKCSKEENPILSEEDSVIELLKYYPLKVGNRWVYDTIITHSLPWAENDTIITVIDVINIRYEGDRKICELKEQSIYPKDSNNVLINYFEDEIDSLTGIVIRTGPRVQTEIWFDLTASAGDTIRLPSYNGLILICIGVTPENIFGLQTYTKHYKRFVAFQHWEYKYSKYLGCTYYFTAHEYASRNQTLIGCLIDEIVYGDTTTVIGQ